MANTTELTKYGFTREQADALHNAFGRKAEHGFDRPTLMWLIGGLIALGLAADGFIWAELRAEIGSARDELRAEIAANRAEIAANRAEIAELAKGMARIETILEERLPRNR